jgi:hypothetical protein
MGMLALTGARRRQKETALNSAAHAGTALSLSRHAHRVRAGYMVPAAGRA